MTEAHWQPLRDELNRWGGAGLKAQLWLRDDDAVESSPALDRLHRISRNAEIPLTLAVIPARTGNALAQYVNGSELISVAVHGWSHANHAPAHEKKQELGPHRPTQAILSELQQGLVTIRTLFGGHAMPVLVPPWNRIDPSLVAKLPEIGFTALSAFGHKIHAGIHTINTHVDIIDWHGTRGCVDHVILVQRLAEELAASRLSGQYPIGILTHHLVHDESAFEFLEALFNEVLGLPCQWPHPEEIML